MLPIAAGSEDDPRIPLDLLQPKQRAKRNRRDGGNRNVQNDGDGDGVGNHDNVIAVPDDQPPVNPDVQVELMEGVARVAHQYDAVRFAPPPEVVDHEDDDFGQVPDPPRAPPVLPLPDLNQAARQERATRHLVSDCWPGRSSLVS